MRAGMKIMRRALPLAACLFMCGCGDSEPSKPKEKSPEEILRDQKRQVEKQLSSLKLTTPPSGDLNDASEAMEFLAEEGRP